MSGGTAARLTRDRRRTEDGQLLGGRCGPCPPVAWLYVEVLWL